MEEQFVYGTDDVLELLDSLFADKGNSWWDSFFADRSKTCPFFVDAPDENLVEWLDRGLIGTGRALELGCGNGRNAAYLAGRGYSVVLLTSRQRRSNGRRSGRRPSAPQ